jgi:hypothetical protein
MAGRTFSVTTSRGTFDGRALRAKRWLQERRQCARSARITLFSVAQELRDGESGEELSRHMVWLRITAAAKHAGCHSVANHATSTGARGCGWDTVSGRIAHRGRRGIKRPEHRAHSSRFDGGAALLTLCTQGAGATVANTCGIQDPQRTISFRPPLLGIEGVEGRDRAADTSRL